MASGKQLIIERILRDREGIWDQIIAERDLPKLILRMLLCSAISLAAYGAVLGASNSWLQALVSTVKLPLLFLATLAICLPTLYLFNLVFGARLSVLQACALIMVAITVTAVLTFAFAPISLFFLITARSYAFFKLLNVAILALTALIGLRFLTSGMRALNKHVAAESMLSNQVVVPAQLPERELVSATVGGAADPATQPPTNGDAPTGSRNQNRAAKTMQPHTAAGERRRACYCCTSGSCCLVSSEPNSPGPCARSSAAPVSRSRCSGTSTAPSTATSCRRWAVCSAEQTSRHAEIHNGLTPLTTYTIWSVGESDGGR